MKRLALLALLLLTGCQTLLHNEWDTVGDAIPACMVIGEAAERGPDGKVRCTNTPHNYRVAAPGT